MSATLARGSFYDALANEARVARSSLPSVRFVRLKSKVAERVLMLTTFNGQTAIESVLGADFADDMITCVDATVLLKRLAAMPDGAIGLATNDTGLTMTAGDGKFKNDMKVGRDVELATGEVVTISSIFQSSGGEYIQTHQAGENMLPPGVEINLESGQDRCIHDSFLRSILFDERQLDELTNEITLLCEMAKPWRVEDDDGKSKAYEETALRKLPVEEQVVKFCSALGYFTGTEKWTRYPSLCPYIVLLTDGAFYVAEHGAEQGNTAYWVIDAIASVQGEAALMKNDFQVWKLVVHPPDEPGPAQDSATASAQFNPGQNPEKPFNPHRHASLICTDGNNEELVRQEIEMTDFLPAGEITFYASVEEQPDISTRQKVMIILLSSEY
jgi:hypothetical protein